MYFLFSYCPTGSDHRYNTDIFSNLFIDISVLGNSSSLLKMSRAWPLPMTRVKWLLVDFIYLKNKTQKPSVSRINPRTLIRSSFSKPITPSNFFQRSLQTSLLKVIFFPITVSTYLWLLLPSQDHYPTHESLIYSRCFDSLNKANCIKLCNIRTTFTLM